MRTSTSLRWLVAALSAAMLLAVAAACGSETVEVPGETVVVEKEVIKEVQVPGETVVVEKEVVKTVEVEKIVEVAPERYVKNVWGELVEKPQHGGTLTIAIERDIAQFDVFYGGDAGMTNKVFNDPLAGMDWAIPPDEYDWTQGHGNMDSITGLLAESWETPDPLTMIVHIRKGVHWWDKPPMNGREVTAYDVEWTWNRMLGTGELAEADSSPFAYGLMESPIVSIEATDKYTVVVKTSEYSLLSLGGLLFSYSSFAHPREVIEEYGDMQDWRNVAGYGAFMLTDVVSGSSVTWTKNPTYWQYDSRHPDRELQLPYVDELRWLLMPDKAARDAALRTGKSDITRGLTGEDMLSLTKTNPELVVVPVGGSGWMSPTLLTDRPPFDDINVRIAMQKAINLEEFSAGFFNRQAEPTPAGCVGDAGSTLAYEQWPEETKWKYEYDPQEAERLLDEAGYPRGADGVRFTTNYDALPGLMEDMAQIGQSYWAEIGVDVEVNVIGDDNLYWARMDPRGDSDYGGITMDTCRDQLPPLRRAAGSVGNLRLYFHSDGGWGTAKVNDPAFDAIVDGAMATTDPEEYKRLTTEADMYSTEQMWALYFPTPNSYVVFQPWLKGFRGEGGSGGEVFLYSLKYMWIDQEMKRGLGR